MTRLSKWRPRKQIASIHAPANLRTWLIEPRSITRRMRRICRGRFRVKLVHQQRERPFQDEARALDLRRAQSALVRQAVLSCGDEPWVYARTVFPWSALRGEYRRLAHLGNNPLGVVLFSNRHVRRGPVEFSEIQQGETLHELAAAALGCQPKGAWARRSTFLLAGKPILVTELFLPEFVNG